MQLLQHVKQGVNHTRNRLNIGIMASKDGHKSHTRLNIQQLSQQVTLTSGTFHMLCDGITIQAVLTTKHQGRYGLGC